MFLKFDKWYKHQYREEFLFCWVFCTLIVFPCTCRVIIRHLIRQNVSSQTQGRLFGAEYSRTNSSKAKLPLRTRLALYTYSKRISYRYTRIPFFWLASLPEALNSNSSGTGWAIVNAHEVNYAACNLAHINLPSNLAVPAEFSRTAKFYGKVQFLEVKPGALPPQLLTLRPNFITSANWLIWGTTV